MSNIADYRFRSVSLVLLTTGVLFGLAGCAKEQVPVAFEPNLVHAKKYEIKEKLPMEQVLRDANWITDKLFGTPDEPRLPEWVASDDDLASLISLQRLKRAAGPIQEGSGLYRKHCSVCHGVTGNGRGETAAVIMPYPRDYRMGIFKFKTTKRGSKPTREDIALQIRNGIPGTQMAKIPGLSEEDVQALAEYVIYLSIRGELERQLIDDAVFELDLEAGERVLDTEFASRMNPEAVEEFKKTIADWKAAGKSEDAEPANLEEFELYQESWEIVEDFVAGLFEDWLGAEDDVIEVPTPPAAIPVAQSRAEFDQLSKSDQAEALQASVNRGRELFVGKVTSCSTCHGEKGLGDGQTTDYDDWTKDWTSRVGLKPEDYDSLIPLLARGALPPVNAIPRNFAEGVFRGGSSSADLYRRIVSGIEGSPMPAATFVENEFEADDVWHLINFIRSLQTQDMETEAAPTATNTSEPPEEKSV